MLRLAHEDMQKVGIGGSAALFGVLISTMWIKIRFIGFVLTLGFTVIAHPMFWQVALDNGWLVAGACLVLLMAFNILVVKMYVGSTLLSNGTYIRHPGTWMTYFLMSARLHGHWLAVLASCWWWWSCCCTQWQHLTGPAAYSTVP